MSGPPSNGRSGRRRGAWWLVAGVVVLAVAAIIGSYFWVRSQYFVGAEDGVVVVYRGVNGSVLGVQLSSLQEESCEPGLQLCAPLKVEDLVPAAQAQVTAGIQAGTLDDARNVITRLAGQMLPLCPVPTTTPSPTPTSPQSSGATPGTAGSALTRATATPPPPGTGTTGTAPIPPTSPATGTAVNPTDATGPTFPLGSGAVLSTLANGSVVTAQNGATSPAATGTPLSTRAPEPGVTCRVVK